jgi:transposase IS116/IS110/IS902 family protein
VIIEGVVAARLLTMGRAQGTGQRGEHKEPDKLSWSVPDQMALSPNDVRGNFSPAIDRPTRISKVGNATLRSSLYMPALSAMRYNPAIIALVARLKNAGRLKPKQIVVAAIRKLLVICSGVLKTGKPFDPTIAMPA